MALLDKRLDHGDHGADLLGGAGAHIGIEHVGGAHDADELVGELRRDLGSRTAVADVNVVVDRGAAHVHADLAGLDGLELFLFMGSAVVDTHSLLLNGFL